MFDFNAHYRVGNEGVAWYAVRHEYTEDDAEQFEWSGIHEFDTDRVVMVMVGDDREFTFGTDAVTPIADTDFCRDCGQIGCGCNVYS